MPDILPRDTFQPEPEPDIRELAQAMPGALGIRSLALTGLFILACFYTLYFASEFFLPLALATVLNFLLLPLVRGLKRLHIPEFAGAAVVIAGVLSTVGIIGYQLSGPVAEWVGRAPQIARKIERQVRDWKKPVEKVTQAGERVQELTAMGADRAPTVEIKKPGIAETVFARTLNFVFGAVVLIILLYFLLASGDMFLRKMIRILPSLEDKKRAVQIAREIELNVSNYLFTQALINLGIGTAAGVTFWILGMPNPLLWGVIAFLLHFIPYVGALTMTIITALVAAATYPTPGQMILPPALYVLFATIEGNVITPWVMGHRLTLNPVVVFVSLIFWGWLWGIAGALLAVPMLAMLKIFCDHIEPLAPIGEFLGT